MRSNNLSVPDDDDYNADWQDKLAMSSMHVLACSLNKLSWRVYMYLWSLLHTERQHKINDAEIQVLSRQNTNEDLTFNHLRTEISEKQNNKK